MATHRVLAAWHDGSSAVSTASHLFRADCTGSGKVPRSRRASASHRGVLMSGLDRITDLTPCCPFVRRYSVASVPPHECPRMCTSRRPSALRSASSSSTNRAVVHKLRSVGRSDWPEPNWSYRMTRRSVASLLALGLLVVLVFVAARMSVPYVTISPGPTVNVLGDVAVERLQRAAVAPETLHGADQGALSEELLRHGVGTDSQVFSQEPFTKGRNAAADGWITGCVDCEIAFSIHAHRAVTEIGRSDTHESIIDDAHLTVHADALSL